MASPQKENGYTPIANEILHALMGCKLLNYEFRVITAVMRKTYGWGKKTDWISNSQIHEVTGIAKPNVTRTVKSLINKKILLKEGKNIGLQKNWEFWEVEWYIDKKVISRDNSVISPDNKKLSHQIPTKEKKETIQNKLSEQSSVNKVMAWKKYNEDNHYEEKTIDLDTNSLVEEKEEKQNKEERELRNKMRSNIKTLRSGLGLPPLDPKQMNWQLKDYQILLKRGWTHEQIAKEFINITVSDTWKEKIKNGEVPGLNTVEFALRNKTP